MKKNKLIIITIITNFIFSCVNNEDSKNLEKSFYDSGELKIEYELINDTIKNGFYKEFYKNGEISYQVEFKKNKEHGWASWYYQNGKLQGQVFFYEGTKIGIGKFYHPNQKLSSYICYYSCANELRGEVFYRSDYDELGRLIKEDGWYLPKFIMSPNEIKKGEVFWVEIYVARPPHLENILYIGESDSSSIFINKKEALIEENSSYYLFEKQYTEAGIYYFKLVVEKNELTNNFINKDSANIKIIVHDVP